MNRIIRTLGVPKSSLYYKAKGYPQVRESARKAVAEPLRQAILQITGKRATYGTPRVRALLQRDYAISVSAYMVHRCMKEEGLLICRNRRRGSSRPHEGTIAVEQPNTRWASDITSIKCWNAQKIRLAFVLDCCDRSILAWSARAHMQACDIELMLQRALFKRFGQAPPGEGQLQFLHDNGPEYIEKGLRKQLEKWNIVDCNTPTYSPQSNGMCEALNGTFKRDYVYEHCLDNPQVVIDQIQGWIDDYNGSAPHSALKMKTPNEYFNLETAA